MLKIAWSPNYCHPLPSGHRFPMEKYELIPEQLEYEGSIASSQLFKPELLEKDVALLTHSEQYFDDLETENIAPQMVRKIGFPFSKELFKRELTITQGTIDCACFALKNQIAFNVAGGTHHAFYESGEGFCILNDISVAANYLLYKGLRNRILIIDLDVHQGNGTASIFSKEERIFTFSMHGQNNYPLRKENSDLDIGLPDGIDDTRYLSLLAYQIPKLFQDIEPDFVFYQAGVDILETDRLGRLKITRNGCLERDNLVLKNCYSNKVPVVVVMGGGYSTLLTDIVEAHCNTFRTAMNLFF